MQPSTLARLLYTCLCILALLALPPSCGEPDTSPTGTTSGSCESTSSGSSSSSSSSSGGVILACPTDVCDDGDPCTADTLLSGTCISSPLPDGTICDDHGDMYCSAGRCVTWTNPLTCRHHADCGPANDSGEPTQFCLAGLCWPSCEGSNAGSCKTVKPGSTCSLLREPPFAHEVCQNILAPKNLPSCSTQADCPATTLCIEGSCWVDCSGVNYDRCLDEEDHATTSCKRKVSGCETFYVCQP